MLTDSKPLPVVIAPHGGPHSVFSTNFNTVLPYTYLAIALNACLVLVNYRGSIGFGEESINSLPGNIGDNDMNDILSVISHLKSNPKTVDVELNFEKLCIVGGSHGGYLTSIAMGKYPQMFKAAAMRNPVTNIAAMYTVSDIPGKNYYAA